MKKIPTVEQLKRYFDRIIEIEKLPVTYERTRDGWAGYRSNEAYGKLRITKFHFSEEAAREEVIAQDARRIKVE